MTATSSDIVETFVYILFVEASEVRIDLLLQMTVVVKCLWKLQSTFAKLQSTVQMESSRSCTKTIRTTSFEYLNSC